MVDIDLLVRKGDLHLAEHELMKMGYMIDDEGFWTGEKTRHFIYRYPEKDFHYEIHWTLFESEHPSQIDREGLWNRAEPVVESQAPAQALSCDDLWYTSACMLQNICFG